MLNHTLRRATGALGVLGATGAALVVLAAPASAHVTVNPPTTPGGGYGKVTFRVPTESDTASTTKLEVVLPADHPLASVSVRPVPGWTARTTMTKLAKPLTTDDGRITEAVSRITWTASPGAAIRPGQFQEFDVSAGPLPDSGTLTFKALQTYSDGSVVRWIDPTRKGQPEPEHPAPVLTLTPAADDEAAAAATPTPAADQDHDSGSGTATAALVVSVVALVVALAGAALAFVRRRA